MPKITKAQSAKLEKLQTLADAMTWKVFAFSKNNDRFADCLIMADDRTRADYYAASANLSDFERAMLAERRGYTDTFGHFKPY